MKKYKQLGLISIVIILVFIIIGSLNKSPIHKSTSPDGKNILMFYHKESFLFGDAPILITAKHKGSFSPLKTLKYKTSISNDGKSLTPKNFSISWIDDNTSIITLIGDTAVNEKIKIIFDDDITYQVL